MCKLLKALGKAPQLTSLALAGNELCQLAAQSLGAWLAKSSCPLLSLDLSRNPFGDQGGEALAKGLRTNCRLQTLQLDECMLTDSSARKFQKTLKLNSRLCRLSLSWNGIEANGVIDLIQAVLAAHVDKPPTAKPALHHLDVSVRLPRVHNSHGQPVSRAAMGRRAHRPPPLMQSPKPTRIARLLVEGGGRHPLPRPYRSPRRESSTRPCGG